MLNPSTAEAEIDDPTIRRCMAFAQAWGYSALSVRNLFALRATNPREILKAEDPVGPQGDTELAVATTASRVVVAWGAKVPFDRDRKAMAMLQGVPLWCLGTTKHGHPRHPLYVAGSQPLVPFASATLR